ncbi:LuxR C-terminal-related transcriptional regulator [Citrobacter rodentium NBRC 105723 = DSM 16636]|uniref:response regulator transcription factor n=1 Tax=Citrobacter rodentium TaxID=67825 RepID=UPI001E3BAA67|nr:LuxR C-terminal-related transcriptional regulator [Citrobacter rodentium]UHO31039.1 LuxR C-terminal-related transcriptional regulator [Citrobacter rodentium NBRC 105723 = DSM 16636]
MKPPSALRRARRDSQDYRTDPVPENIPFISKNLMQIVDETDDRQLSPYAKEWEVLYLVAQGCSISDIAGRKNKSNSTVATQKQNAMKKLNLSSNSELIKYMYVTGMME